jgi:hypothetical protein
MSSVRSRGAVQCHPLRSWAYCCVFVITGLRPRWKTPAIPERLRGEHRETE